MHYLAAIIASLSLGALTNRWRGGGLFVLPGETLTQAHTQLRRVSAAIVMGVLGLNPLAAMIYFAAYLPGVGVPFGALGGWNTAALKEMKILDEAAYWLCLKTVGPATLHQRVWGFAWVTLWGIAIGALMSVTLLSIYPVLVYAFMGVAALVATTVIKLVGKTPTIAASEWATGALQGLALALGAHHG